MRGAMAGQLLAQRRRRRVRGAMLAVNIVVAATAANGADIEFGRYLSSECVTCHGVAKTGDAIPDIVGMPDATFVEVVKAYRDKRLPNQVMQNIASRLNDAEIAALAAYFATAKKTK